MTIRRTITLIALFLLTFHFSLTLLYNSPLHVPYVDKYMTPLFDQNWRFFAPDPPTESRTLFFRYRSNNNRAWSGWVNPGKMSQTKFDYNRFSYHGKLVHLSATICHYLNAERLNIVYEEGYQNLSKKEQINTFNEKILKTGSVDLAKNYLKNWILWKFKVEANELQLILLVKDNKTDNTKSTLFPTLTL